MEHDSFPHLWFASLTVLFIALGSLLAYDVYQELRPPYNPLRYPVPQRITSSAVVQAGDVLLVNAQKCNDSHEPVLVIANSWWKRQDDQGLVPYQSGQRVLEPGCVTLMFTNTTPETLAPGLWRLEGRECIKTDVCGTWFSDTFRVVP